MQSACGIEDHQIVVLLFRFLHGHSGNVRDREVRTGCKHRNVQLFAVALQLIDGGRPVDVAGNQKGIPIFFLPQLRRQFCARSRFAGALKACHQEDRDLVARLQTDVRGFAAHGGDQFLVDDLDDLLAGGQGVHDLTADGSFLDAPDEVLDDFIVDVGFQKSKLDLAHCALDVCLGQEAFVGQLLEGILQFVR